MTASHLPLSRRFAYCRRVSLFLAALALCLGLGADNFTRAATVIGSIQDVNSRPYGGMVNQILFTPLSCPQAIGTNTIWPVAKAARLTNGFFSVNLVGGLYYVGILDGPIGLTPKTVKILVPPNDTNIWQFNICANLATNLGTFSWTNTPQGVKVYTTNSVTVTFSGDGTPTNPLTATATVSTVSYDNMTGTNANLSGAFAGVLTGQVMTGERETPVVVSPFATVLSYNADEDLFTFRSYSTVNTGPQNVANSWSVSTPSSGRIEMSTTSGNPYLQMRDVDDNETINIAGYNGNVKARTVSLMNDSIVLGQPLYGETYPGATIFGGVHWSAGSYEGYLREDGSIYAMSIGLGTLDIDSQKPFQVATDGSFFALSGLFSVNTGGAIHAANGQFEIDSTGKMTAGSVPAARLPGITTNLQFKMTGYTTNTLYFTNGILMRVSTP